MTSNARFSLWLNTPEEVADSEALVGNAPAEAGWVTFDFGGVGEFTIFTGDASAQVCLAALFEDAARQIRKLRGRATGDDGTTAAYVLTDAGRRAIEAPAH